MEKILMRYFKVLALFSALSVFMSSEMQCMHLADNPQEEKSSKGLQLYKLSVDDNSSSLSVSSLNNLQEEGAFSLLPTELRKLILRLTCDLLVNIQNQKHLERESLVIRWNISNVCTEWRRYFIEILQENNVAVEQFLRSYCSIFTIEGDGGLEGLKESVYFHKKDWSFPWIWDSSWKFFQEYCLWPILENGLQKFNTNLLTLNIQKDFDWTTTSNICSLKYFLITTNLCNLIFKGNNTRVAIPLKKLFDDSRVSERIQNVVLGNLPMNIVIDGMSLLHCRQLTLIDPVGTFDYETLKERFCHAKFHIFELKSTEKDISEENIKLANALMKMKVIDELDVKIIIPPLSAMAVGKYNLRGGSHIVAEHSFKMAIAGGLKEEGTYWLAELFSSKYYNSPQYKIKAKEIYSSLEQGNFKDSAKARLKEDKFITTNKRDPKECCEAILEYYEILRNLEKEDSEQYNQASQDYAWILENYPTLFNLQEDASNTVIELLEKNSCIKEGSRYFLNERIEEIYLYLTHSKIKSFFVSGTKGLYKFYINQKRYDEAEAWLREALGEGRYLHLISEASIHQIEAKHTPALVKLQDGTYKFVIDTRNGIEYIPSNGRFPSKYNFKILADEEQVPNDQQGNVYLKQGNNNQLKYIFAHNKITRGLNKIKEKLTHENFPIYRELIVGQIEEHGHIHLLDLDNIFSNSEQGKIFLEDNHPLLKYVTKKGSYSQKEALHKKNNPDLLFLLGDFYKKIRKNSEKSIFYYQQASNSNNTYAMFALSRIVLLQERNLEEKIKLYLDLNKKAADLGNSYSAYYLHQAYKGEFLDKDNGSKIKLPPELLADDQAIYWLDKACCLGNPWAVSLKYHQLSKKKNYQEAIKYLENSICSPSLYYDSIGYCYMMLYNNDKEESQFILARDHLQSAIAMNTPISLVKLGWLHFLRWQNEGTSEYLYSAIESTQSFLDLDLDDGLEKFKEGANKNLHTYCDSMVKLGWLHFLRWQHDHIPEDLELAKNYTLSFLKLNLGNSFKEIKERSKKNLMLFKKHSK